MPPAARDALAQLGWDASWSARAAATGAPGEPGRVVRVDKRLATVSTEAGSVRADPGPHDVATGDWVLVDGEAVTAVLERTSAFVRGDPLEGRARKAQVLAANVDVVLVVQSLTNGPNARRLERELVLSFESGATPVVVLTKSDAVTEDVLDDACALVARSAPGVETVVTSARTNEGLGRLHELARDGRTIALIGASGVGKSTLVNALVGTDVQETGEVRESDQRGRHTTTARELVLIPGGGVLVDTPGLRAVALWEGDEGLSLAFSDIEELATQCKFSDCSHNSEPGCAVQAAIESGALDAARLEHYERLDAELDETERRRRGREGSRALRRFYQERGRS